MDYGTAGMIGILSLILIFPAYFFVSWQVPRARIMLALFISGCVFSFIKGTGILGLLLFIAGSVMLIVFVIMLICSGFENYNEEKVEDNNERKVTFYTKCNDLGIKNLKDLKEPNKLQKAELLAKQLGLEDDPSTLFREAKAILNERKQAAKETERQVQINTERADYKHALAFSDLYGREKRLLVFSREYAEAKKSEAKWSSKATAIQKACFSEKESSWAIHGGIAEGIAGPAAGLATAMRIEAENAQIRERNKARLESAMPVVNRYHSYAAYSCRTAEEYANYINETKLKVVSNDDAAKCFNNLSFSHISYKVSTTGACKVTLKVKLINPVSILKKDDGVIDGTIKANVYDDGKLLGTALLVLPTYGIGSKARLTLTGLFLNCPQPRDKEYTISLEPNKLWAMER